VWPFLQNVGIFNSCFFVDSRFLFFFVLASVAVVFRLCRAADAVPRTRRLIGFICRRTASVEQAADGAEAAAVDQYFSSPAENIFDPVCLWTPGLQTDD